MARFDDDSHDDEPPDLDINAVHRREWRRLDLERRRRAARQKLVGGLLGLLVVVGVAYAAFNYISGGESASPDPQASVSPDPGTAAPVRVTINQPSEDLSSPTSDPATSATDPSATTDPELSVGGPDGVGGKGAVATPAVPGSLADQARAAGGDNSSTGATATANTKKPIVWIQAGHTSPREPGYSAQTGARAGAFGNEANFTANLAPKVIAKLKAAGVDARYTPGLVTPIRSRGAVFLSLHYDTPEGRSMIGYAIPGVNENYYHGEGTGTPSPVPYSDSGQHRPPTTVASQVSSRSQDLANRLSTRYRAIFTSANGARSAYGGVQTPTSNPRVMRYYGYYRTLADARVLIECGAGVTDDGLLSKTDTLATAISRGIVDHLRARALLARSEPVKPDETDREVVP